MILLPKAGAYVECISDVADNRRRLAGDEVRRCLFGSHGRSWNDLMFFRPGRIRICGDDGRRCHGMVVRDRLLVDLGRSRRTLFFR